MVDYDFENDVVAITGAASGIGAETAREFGAAGASVVVADVDDDGGESVVDEIESAGGEAVYVNTDVTEMGDVEAMVETAVSEFGGLDYAVNNAGIGGPAEAAGGIDESDWEQTVDINLNGVWRAMAAELDAMGESGGAIVNMASIMGQIGMENTAAYVAAKHGVLGLTKTAAWEYADDDIRVNAVCPGFVETQMLADAGITTNEGVRQHIEGKHSQDRLAQPEEIAAAVLWLCSDDASFTNGEGLTVDSGYTAV
ncbi:SDR family NAD(P)-dependent oxidoreductase [Halococcoides cellulosivorans]|uniref:Short-chain dehydrogenase n=1 Tax=Halococcoides cellulosivorans TaxID=1679096 RepID=A0A2R4X419_9EURY|nr:SDR family oxidoreductase [Halococcoides cellulosivorans]AWB28544.1 short-chain dehydrogenase [Halococcoides cellulosivorans]